MVRQIIWTERAQKERKEIFTFWNAHNKSSFYSRKLNELIKESLKLICIHPFIGKPTTKENVRVKILKDYLIIYQITATEIIVLSIWDNRQSIEKSAIK
ncbi:MAG: type II toxin-antitoxin system RelE/ParE family toxin [Prolixibacteraceae bacterium]|nr:type II toxin-antitoxin system RelE/ParE family toxin [Prolixibacteraceae bacterium]